VRLKVCALLLPISIVMLSEVNLFMTECERNDRGIKRDLRQKISIDREIRSRIAQGAFQTAGCN
jgi:hypothetical protein